MTNAACSGAGIWALTQGWSAKHVGSQLSTIGAIKPTIISVTIGGNSIIQGRAETAHPVDWGFPDVLQQCFLGGPFDNERCLKNGTLATAERAIEGISPAGSSSLVARLTRAYREISAADPKANIYVVGYPEIFPPSSATPFHCGWLGKAEQVELDRLTVDLDNVIQTATLNAGVSFISTLNAFSDASGNHQLCTQDSWMVPISLVNGLGASLGVDSSPGHPTAKGQYAIAQAVGAFLDTKPVDEWSQTIPPPARTLAANILFDAQRQDLAALLQLCTESMGWCSPSLTRDLWSPANIASRNLWGQLIRTLTLTHAHRSDGTDVPYSWPDFVANSTQPGNYYWTPLDTQDENILGPQTLSNGLEVTVVCPENTQTGGYENPPCLVSRIGQ
jgi:hypothetical protein